ncbi:hypothetical protein BUALT_Bualt10G0029600 [Buddleja alternifolia]|uniref:DDE Tnp4 domain-containing protein n=1 Tax=Buddleja alternifolia TaxID=168488 RepID=A0AAV6WX36_9LAMI|nr:hypothetical protein BUALT_Bualt10G0029600 [Buddleja alternifolia]
MARRMPDQISRVFRLTGNNDADCLSQLRMYMSTFVMLLITACWGVCVIQSHTVSLYFNSVLTAVLKLHPLIFVTPKPVDDECTNARWKSFKGCLGALGGTYIYVQTPLLDKPRYRNRKAKMSVNILGVVNEEMHFVYMLSEWEGSAANGRVLRNAVNRANGLKVPNGQYYLCPYRSVRYQLDEWLEGSRAPQNAKELFNQQHTKARNVIERTWSIMKWRWAVLRSTTFWLVR